MAIPFLDGFQLEIDNEHNQTHIIEDGLSSIGVLSSIAQDCSNLVAALREGSEPNEQMLSQVAYASSIVSGLSENVSNILVGIEVQRIGAGRG